MQIPHYVLTPPITDDNPPECVRPRRFDGDAGQPLALHVDDMTRNPHSTSKKVPEGLGCG
jgi:hypothetical protein